MSVLIKGMEMPESCSKCAFGDGYSCYAKGYIVQEDDWENKRADFCPLVEVPDGHGRLIDADALLDKQAADAKIFEGSTFYDDKVRYDEATNAVANIINAPTVIPSDKDGEA